MSVFGVFQQVFTRSSDLEGSVCLSRAKCAATNLEGEVRLCMTIEHTSAERMEA